MGVRLSLGLGYGILLDEERKCIPLEEITEPLSRFLSSKIHEFNDEKGKDNTVDRLHRKSLNQVHSRNLP
jgi:hypothetical protein